MNSHPDDKSKLMNLQEKNIDLVHLAMNICPWRRVHFYKQLNILIFKVYYTPNGAELISAPR